MKFGDYIILVQAMLNLYFQFSEIINKNMADARTCNEGAKEWHRVLKFCVVGKCKVISLQSVEE
jgi:hypothetical protein